MNPILFVFSVTGLVISIIAFRRPRLGLILLLVLLAIADWVKRLLYIFPPVSQKEIFAVLLVPDVVLAAIFARILLDIIVTKKIDFRLQIPDVLLGAFFCWAIVTFLISGPSLAVKLAGFKFTVLYVVLYPVGAAIVRSKEDVEKLFATFIVLAVPIGLYAVYQFFHGPTWYEWAWLKSGFTRVYNPEKGIGDAGIFNLFRPFSTFGSWDILGFHMMFALLMAFYFIVTHGRDKVRWANLAVFPLIVGFSAISVTRSPWVGIAVAFLTIFVYVKTSGTLLRFGLVFFMVMLFFLLLPWLAGMSKASESAFVQRVGNIVTMNARVEGLDAFLYDPKFHRVFGNGLGTSGAFVGSKFGGSIGLQTHNSFFTYTYDLGLVGLGLILLFFVSYFLSLKNILRLDLSREDRWILLTCFGLIVGFLAATFLNENFSMRPANIYFWLTCGAVSRFSLWMKPAS